MDNSIYEVERNEYAGFIGQLNKDMMEVEQCYENELTIMKIRSKNTGIHLCTRIIPKEGEEHYYIFKIPSDNERVAPKPIMKVTLETKEDVQHFFNALGKIQQEAHENVGTV